MDAIYNAISRPLANEPDKKDAYRVDAPHKDAKAKNLEEDDAKEGKKQKQELELYNEESEQSNEPDLTAPKGKGKYIDENGKPRLDFFV